MIAPDRRAGTGGTLMTKLHEILAVEGGLDATQRKIVDEARETFTKRADHFIEMHRALSMFDEAAAGQNSEEHKEMVTTVPEKLEHVARIVSRHLDVVFQKDRANQSANADIVIDGMTLVSGVPATTLLGLETRLAMLREMYLAIPTLSPGRQWVRDEQRGLHVWRDANPEVRLKTQKTPQHKILVEPTKEHPAQIEKWFEDVAVGRITTSTWSGMLSPGQKSELLERLDRLIRAVKRARQRANQVEVDQAARIGQKLFDYIHPRPGAVR